VTFLDIVKLASTILVSLGGGGAIVFGLSNFLGKLWADRALEDHRQKYNQLNMQMLHDLENASRRLQVELDALGLIHSLRTKEEFARISVFWKSITNLPFAFHTMASTGLALGPSDTEEQKRYKARLREKFEIALMDTQQVFAEEMIFIPEPIAIVAQSLLEELLKEPFLYESLALAGDPRMSRQYIEFRQRFLRSSSRYGTNWNN
jgi:hypothetical protein